MGTKAKGTIEAKSWDEQAYSEIEGGPKLAASKGVDLYRAERDTKIRARGGPATGRRTVNEVRPGRDSTSMRPPCFSTIWRTMPSPSPVPSPLAFVVQIDGTVDAAGNTKAGWKVQPGSGTGQLKGLRGKGGFVYGEKENSYTLDYDFA